MAGHGHDLLTSISVSIVAAAETCACCARCARSPPGLDLATARQHQLAAHNGKPTR